MGEPVPDYNDIDEIYGTNPQVEFARKMAKVLSSREGHEMSPGMAVLPGSWRYGVKDILTQLAGNQYRDIAGSQDKSLRARTLDPSYKTGVARYGGKVSPPAVGPSSPHGTPPTEPKTVSEIKPFTTSVEEYPEHAYYLDEVKKIENEKLFGNSEGKDKAYWDFKQWTNGFGTRAKHQHEEINQQEAHKRFSEEFGEAQEEVNKFAPNLDTGTKMALSSLTFNAGSKWMREGLGKLVKEGASPELIREKFIQYHHAGGKPNPLLLERRNKEAQWIGSEERMNLGGPESPGEVEYKPGGARSIRKTIDEEGKPPGTEVAQAPFPTKAVPVEGMNPSPNQPGGVSGYTGPIPPANPISTPDQLKAQIMNAGSPEQVQQIISEYQKNLEGRSYKTPGGGDLKVQPSAEGGAPIATHIPGGDIPLGIAGMNLNMRQNPNGGFDLILPGGETKGFKTVSDLYRYAADLNTQGESIKNIGAAQTEPIVETVKKSAAAPEAIQTLTTMEGIVKNSKDLSMGPTSPYFNQVKRLFANFFPGSAKGIAEADSIEKLNSLLASESTKLFTNRGTNFDLQTFMNANPNLLQSKEGMLMMIDLLKQEMKQRQDLGNIANRYRTKDVSTWNDRKQDYFDENPIIINVPNAKGGMDKITTKKVTEADIKTMPKGMKFLIPEGKHTGKIGVAPGPE